MIYSCDEPEGVCIVFWLFEKQLFINRSGGGLFFPGKRTQPKSRSLTCHVVVLNLFTSERWDGWTSRTSFCFQQSNFQQILLKGIVPKLNNSPVETGSHTKVWMQEECRILWETSQTIQSHFWMRALKFASNPLMLLACRVNITIHHNRFRLLLRCLWKKREVVLEQTVIQAWWDLCFTPPPWMPSPCQPPTK